MKKTNLFFIFALLILLVAPLTLSASGIQIQPNPANDLDTLHCVVLSGGSGYVYNWYQNGASKSGITGAYVADSYTAAGDTWKCVVKKYYGGGVGWVELGQDSRYVNVAPQNNLPPIVQIFNPNNTAVFANGTNILFNGTAADPEDGVLSGNSLRWYFDGANLFNGSIANYNGLSVGTHTITLNAIDSMGLTGTASVTITINATNGTNVTNNTAPVADITAPADWDSFVNGTNIMFTGTGTDVEDGVLSGNSLNWYIDGTNLFNGTSFSYNGLSAGLHIIILSVRDSQGLAGVDSIRITINATNGTNVTNGTMAVLLTANPLTGNSPLDVTFNCSVINGTAPFNYTYGLIGPLGGSAFGAIRNETSIQFSNTLNDVGTWTARCNVTDSMGQTAGDTEIIAVLNGTNVTNNTAPLVNIITPTNLQVFGNGTNISFTGNATDAEDGVLSGNSLRWYIDGVNLFNGTAYDYSALTVGSHIITLNATDSQNLTAAVSITITINASAVNQLPVVQILQPANGSVFLTNQTVNFLGNAVDTEDGILTGASLQWTIDGVNFGNGTTPSLNLNTTALGQHTITLTATDSQNASASSSIIIIVNATNGAPVVNITLPADNSTFNQTFSIFFQGNAFDPEEGAITVANRLNWTSSIDGAIGNGEFFNFDNLSVGTHVITLSAWDMQGNMGSDSITVLISRLNHAPNATIILPLNNTNFTCGDLINFLGNASDVDNDTPLDLQWFSSVDGFIGNGNATQDVLTCNQTHIINFTVDDLNGGIGSDSISITVLPNLTTNTYPNLTVISPLNGSTFVDCQMINFNASAVDLEGIRSISLIYGSTAVNETIYNNSPNNATLDVTLPASYFGAGNHSVTFRVVDIDGNENSSTILFTVVAHQNPTVAITLPANGSVFNVSTLVNFSATANNNDPVCPTNYSWVWEDNFNQIWNQSESFSSNNLTIGNHTITVYAYDDFSAVDSDQIEIQIVEIPNILPTVQITSPANGSDFINECESIFFNSTAADADGTITRYEWVWGSNTINESASFTLPASYFGNGNHTVRLNVYDNRSGVNTTTVSFSVMAHVAPNITITSPLNNSNYNESQNITFTAVAVPNDRCDVNLSYEWTETGSVLSNLSSFITNNLSIGTHAIVARVDDTLGLYDTAVVFVNVLEIPNIPPVINSLVCLNATNGTTLMEYEPVYCYANATDVDGNVTTWVWSVNNTYGPAFTPYNFTVPGILGNGTYNVVLTVQDNEGNQTTAILPIVITNNAPIVTLTSNVTNGIEPLSVNFTCSVDAGTGNAPYHYSVDFGDGLLTSIYDGNETSVHFMRNYPQNGTFNVTCSVTDRDNDMGNSTVVITVFDTVPVGDWNWTPQPQYECSNVQFTSNITAYDGILSYFWDFMDGANSTAVNPVHNYTQNGNYNVLLTVLDNDRSSSMFNHIVNVLDTVPLVDAGVDRNTTEGVNITLVGSAIKTCDNITGYEWNFGDGSPIQNGQMAEHNFTQNGTYLVTFTAIDSDGSRVSDNITVVVFDTVPTANFTITPNPQTEGQLVTFNASASTGYDQPLNYNWDFGDNTTGTGLVTNHIYAQQGIYTVTLSVRDNDGSVVNRTLPVAILDTVPTANFTVIPNPVVEGQSAAFNAGASTAYDGIANYSWSFGDGNNGTGMATNHIYAQNGTYLATLTVTDNDGSTDDFSVIVIVNDTVPTANFNYVPANPVEGFAINFTDASTAYDNVTVWSWNFGDATPLVNTQNATHTYRYNGTYNVTLTVQDSDGSIANVTRTVIVANLLPTVTLTPLSATGNEPLYVSFNCSATGNAPFTFMFDAQGDNTTELTVVSSTNVIFNWNYTQNGTYAPTCSVLDDDGDADSVSSSVIVNDLGPVANLTGNLTLFEGQMGRFNASGSTSYPDPIVSYEWNWDYAVSPAAFTSGSAVTNHTYADNGNYVVAVRVTDIDGSQDIATINVVVLNVAPNVTIGGPYVVNESFNITFTANATDPGNDTITYEWDFDYDGFTFTVDNTTTAGSIIRSWPDDYTSTVAVRAVDDDGGVSNIAVTSLHVLNVPPVVDAGGPYMCNNGTIIAAGTNVTLSAAAFDYGATFDPLLYLWDLNNDATYETALQNPVFQCAGLPVGLYTVNLRVYDDEFGMGTDSAVINVTDGPVNNPPQFNPPLLPQSAVNGTLFTYNIDAIDPDVGDIITYGLVSPLIGMSIDPVTGVFAWTPTTTGQFNVTVSACDNSGFPNNCTLGNFTINIASQQRAPFAVITPPYTGNEGQILTFVGTGSSDPDNDTIISYQWDFGDGFTGTGATTTHAFADNGNYIVSLTIIDSSGMSNSTTATYVINNVAPNLTLPALVQFNEDTSAALDLTAYSADVAADLPLTWSSTSLNIIVSIVNGTANFTAPANWFGSEAVTITANDGDGGITSQTITVQVLPVNDNPAITSTPITSVQEDVLYNYQLTASDNDTGDVLTFSLVAPPAGMTITTLGLIAWTPDNTQVGIHTITAQVSDGNGGMATQVFNITVSRNDTMIISTPILVGTEGQLYQYDVNSLDENQGDVFTLTTFPAGMTINPVTGLITWTPAAGTAGLHPVTIRVNNSNGELDMQSYILNITPIAVYGVTLTDPADQSVVENANAVYTIFITNTGNVQDTFNLGLSATATTDYAALSVPSITLNAGQTGNFTLTVRDETAGIYFVNVNATSNTSAAAFAQISIQTTVTVAGTLGVTLSDPADQTVLVNNDAIYTITITNTGTLADTYTLGWSNLNGADVAQLSTSSANLAAGASTTFTLTVRDAAAGLYTATVTAVSNTNGAITAGISTTTNVTTSVPPVNVTGTIINSTIYGGFYANNLPSDVTQTSVSNSTYMFYATIQGGVAPVPITGTNNLTYVIFTNVTKIANCTAIGTATTPTVLTNTQCVNQYIDPSNVTTSNTTGTSQIINSGVYYSNATYNLVISDSTINYSTVNNSQVYLMSLIDHSKVLSSYINFSTIMQSNVTNSDVILSIVIKCNVVNSDVGGSSVYNCQIINSTVTNSTLNNTNITNSTIINSTIINSTINDSVINNSNITNSTVDNCTISGSNVSNFYCQNDTIINSTINDTAACGGIVNGYNLSGICIYLPVITTFNVPSSVNNGASASFRAVISNRNSSNNDTPNPFTYAWSFGDGVTDLNGPTNSTTDLTSHVYSGTTPRRTVSLIATNKYGLSSRAVDTITIAQQGCVGSGCGSGGGGGGGSSSAGPLGNAGILNYKGKDVSVSLSECKVPKSAYADFEDVVSTSYDGVTYTIDFTAVTNKSVDMMIYPNKIPLTMLTKGSTIVDLDEDGTDDLSIIMNDIVKEVDPTGFVRYKLNLTLKMVNCKTEEKAPVEKVKEAVTETINDIKTGVLNVMGNITPANKASPVVGSAITAGIIAVGLAGYFGFRKKKPKF